MSGVLELATAALRRDPSAVARAISSVEDRRPAARAEAAHLLDLLGREGRRAAGHRVGITGPPGAGKSTLVSALVKHVRSSGASVGVLAVDPSSRRSGGALLGDRARIEIDPDDHDAFVRSMASGGDLGGLARAAGAALDVLSAAYDVVFVETVGVGQSETDVEHVVDTVVLVVQPASGDTLQFLKAGILEIPAVLAVNKGDLGAVAERAASDLRAALAAERHGTAHEWDTPVLKLSAASGDGVPALWSAIVAHQQHLRRVGDLTARRAKADASWALRLVTQRYGEVLIERRGGTAAVGAELETWIREGASALECVERAGRL